MSTELVPANESTTENNITQTNEMDQFLTFQLQDETYGVDILKVQEIRGWSQVTQIPNAPEFIRGIMNLRGAIVPILDLRRRFQMSETEFTQYTVVIVVNVQDRTIGMIVDAVSDVIELDKNDIRPSPDFGTSIDSSFIHGLAPSDEKMIILLNIDEMLQHCDLVAIDKIKQASTGDTAATETN